MGLYFLIICFAFENPIPPWNLQKNSLWDGSRDVLLESGTHSVINTLSYLPLEKQILSCPDRSSIYYSLHTCQSQSDTNQLCTAGKR